MKIIPTQKFLLLRVHDMPRDSGVELPDEVKIEPYGEVIACGPDVVFSKVGDKVLLLPQNLIGHDKGGDERYIVPESAVYATIEPTQNQDGTEIPNN